MWFRSTSLFREVGFSCWICSAVRFYSREESAVPGVELSKKDNLPTDGWFFVAKGQEMHVLLMRWIKRGL